jgi:hypothetical protein
MVYILTPPIIDMISRTEGHEITCYPTLRPASPPRFQNCPSHLWLRQCAVFADHCRDTALTRKNSPAARRSQAD